jgi:F-type H+-transporting ATPase subunit delta
MSEANTIARPYAVAAFEAAQKQADLKGWSVVLSALAELLNHAELKALVGSPRVSVDQVEGLMLELCGVLNKEQANFIRVLAQSHRLNVATEIAQMYEVLRAEAEKSVQITVSSAFALNDAQQGKITAALKTRLSREIKLSCLVDQTLLGGIVIRMGDKVIDGSARTRLSELGYALA